MNNNYAHITVVLDRSGSMSNIASDMEGGLKDLVKDQKEMPGKCTLSFIRFDYVIEKVLDFADISDLDVESLKLEPRGATALLDAIGYAINETGKTLSNMPESERPALVTVVIVTDGEENSSREFCSKQIAEMIKEQEEKYNWVFTYLGANQDSFSVGANLNLNKNVSNFNTSKASGVFRNYSSKMSSARSMMSQCCNDNYNQVYGAFQYTEKDKEDLE